MQTEKRSHLGMAGHYAAMSEFLYRGYNVAVPSVDVGDDVYVVEDGGGTMWRLQVKTSDGVREERDPDGTMLSIAGTYALSRGQLKEPKENELFFMFVVRWDSRWRFILISRGDLRDIRERFVGADRAGRRGRSPLSDEEAAGDALTLTIRWTRTSAEGWAASLDEYLEKWPATFPENRTAPGAFSAAVPPSGGPGTPQSPPPTTDPP